MPGSADLTIRIDPVECRQVIDLLEQHLALMHEVSPPDSIHALDLDGLRAPDVTFWSVWHNEALVGCGALKQLSPTHGKINSMHTLAAARGQGIGAAMLQHIIDEALHRGYARLSLETGSMAAFVPAQSLYERHGFTYCPPFGDYIADPNSVFMDRTLG